MDAVEDIKGRLSIEDVVSKYVELKRAGRNFRGLSPFGNEKTPSFMVSPEKQIWHDFSSGKGGNMFSFVMEMEGLDFKGALELLARQAGVDLGQYRSGDTGQRTQQKERVYAALELAAKFYQVHFSKSRQAYEYILKKRAFTKATALLFRIGYAPSGDAPLCKFLVSKGFTEQEIHAAGLGSKRYGGYRDMFRGRIMIPLMDAQGRVIGFTARLLEDDADAPKYINTPATLVYDKSRHVFGLHLAKEAIRKNGYGVVVEGNLDVIASHQAGVAQVVATAGTAMTEMHLKTLGRFAHDVRVAFDQDSAGIAATERTIPLAARTGVSLSIIDIPAGKDPDELIQKDPGSWERAINKHKYALDWLMQQYQKRLDITSAVGKREFSDVLLKVVRGLGDPVEQDHYLTKIAELIAVSPDALRDKLVRGGKTDTRFSALRKSVPQVARDPGSVEQIKAQNQLLALILLEPTLREFLTPLQEDMLPDSSAQKLLAYLRKHPDYVYKRTSGQSTTSEYADILVLLFDELYQGLEINELRYEATRLQTRLIDYYVKTKKAALTLALREADGEQTTALLEQVKTLNTLLKS